MLIAYIFRSWQELIRFKKRNLISLLGLVTMVGLLAFLFSVMVQVNDVFEKGDEDLSHRMRIISVIRSDFNEHKFKLLADMEGVDHILPITNSLSYPWSHIRMGDFAVLPVYIHFYDPEYASFFQDEGLMSQTLGGRSETIVPAAFSNHILSLEQYQRTFGIAQPGSLEVLGDSISKLVKQYQEYQNASETIANPDMELVGQRLDISIEDKYFADLNRDVPPHSATQITGQLKPNVLDFGANHIFMPSTSRNFFVPTDRKPTYSMVYIKAKSIEDVPVVISQLQEMGYQVPDKLDTIRNNLNSASQFLKNIAVLMAIILFISMINFANTMFSSIEERKKDISIRKALGASSRQIVSGFILEGVMLVVISSIIGLMIAFVCFSGLRSYIQSGQLSFRSFDIYGLDQKSIAYIFQMNLQVSLMILISMILLGAIVSYLVSTIFVRRNTLSLMKEGG